MEFIAHDTGDLPKIAEEIIQLAGAHRIFAFYGKMGAGKTTLILQLLKHIGVSDAGSSPTYSLVNAYKSENLGPVYHFDFYRIESIDEVYDIGYEEYFFSGSYCFMEWPEKIGELLPEEAAKIFIEEDKNLRKIRLELPS